MNISTKKMVHCAMYVVIGIVLPMAFHTVNMAGNIFLPMHIPVLLCGMGLGPLAGLVVGAFTPLLSSLLTGMPPILPALPLMLGELITYGVVSGFLYKKYHRGIFFSLVVSMLLGRMVSITLFYILALALHWTIPFKQFVISLFVYGLPGIVLQLVLIPLIVKRLEGIHFRRS